MIDTRKRTRRLGPRSCSPNIVSTTSIVVNTRHDTRTSTNQQEVAQVSLSFTVLSLKPRKPLAPRKFYTAVPTRPRPRTGSELEAEPKPVPAPVT